MSESQTIPAPISANVLTSVSALVGMTVVDAAGKDCGRVHEFAVHVDRDGSRVESLILQRKEDGKKRTLMVPVGDVALPKASDKVLHTKISPTLEPNMQHYLLLERDLLDQQIIDVDGRKVVRVNDVNLAWEPSAGANAEA